MTNEWMHPLNAYCFFWVFSLVFSIGLYGVLTRKTVLGFLIGLELLLNSVALNFVAFNRFIAPEAIDGHIFSIFIIAVAAAEAVVALAIMVALFQFKRTAELSRLTSIPDDRPTVAEVAAVPGPGWKQL
jgi:NADH:ubiquinone oxidoreductase subunit K